MPTDKQPHHNQPHAGGGSRYLRPEQRLRLDMRAEFLETFTALRAELETLLADLGDEAFPSLPPRMQRHLLRRAGRWQLAHGGAVERDVILTEEDEEEAPPPRSRAS
jgi:hypothetical protein